MTQNFDGIVMSIWKGGKNAQEKTIKMLKEQKEEEQNDSKLLLQSFSGRELHACSSPEDLELLMGE